MQIINLRYGINDYIFKENRVIGFTAIMQDLTDKKRVEKLSIVDELTQLYNRRHYNIKIKEEINRAK